jgi:regulatory protein
LLQKLLPHTEDPAEVESVLDDLEKRGWLSEARFVEQLTTVRRRKFGAGRILHELREKGVSDAALEEARAQLKGSEVEAARSVWKKKFDSLPQNIEERGKQSRFLASRGFSPEAVRTVLKGGTDDQ